MLFYSKLAQSLLLIYSKLKTYKKRGAKNAKLLVQEIKQKLKKL